MNIIKREIDKIALQREANELWHMHAGAELAITDHVARSERTIRQTAQSCYALLTPINQAVKEERYSGYTAYNLLANPVAYGMEESGLVVDSISIKAGTRRFKGLLSPTKTIYVDFEKPGSHEENAIYRKSRYADTIHVSSNGQVWWDPQPGRWDQPVQTEPLGRALANYRKDYVDQTRNDGEFYQSPSALIQDRARMFSVRLAAVCAMTGALDTALGVKTDTRGIRDLLYDWHTVAGSSESLIPNRLIELMPPIAVSAD